MLIYRNDFFDLNWELENKYLKKYLDSDFGGFNYFDNLEVKNSYQENFISKNKNQKKNFSYKESFFELKFLNDIIKKIKSFSHGEFNKEIFLDKKEIQRKILSNEDIFNRGFRLKKIEMDSSYPEYILKNKEKFSKWII